MSGRLDWSEMFDTADPERPASQDELDALRGVTLAPMSEPEIVEALAAQRNPFPASDPRAASYQPFDPRRWKIPRRSFPDSFVDFLGWSNGGMFTKGKRELGVFGVREIREYLLAYQLPQYMPGAVPFALDGGGGFYLFDMRELPVGGEYPVVYARSGSLGWGLSEHAVVAPSFVAACSGREDPSESWT